MFTGLVERLGSVLGVTPREGGLRFRIAAPGWESETTIGESIAVNGCCLTVVELTADGFAFDVVPESVQRTMLGTLKPGDAVNLERSLRLDQRLGGHLVQGHVDGVGRVLEVAREGEGRRIAFEVPAGLAKFVAEKGSVAIDGVSLTVAACAGTRCEVAFIPHTLEVTVAGRYVPGTRVNIEADLMARYAARLLEAAGEDR
jgi:riboflavin synthase